MRLLTVRLSDDAIEVLNHEAVERGMTLSAMTRALLCAGAHAIGAENLAACYTADDFEGRPRFKIGLNVPTREGKRK